MAVTPEMIAVALGRTAPASDSALFAQWEMWIADAVMLIEARRIDLGSDPVDAAKSDFVVRNVVAAKADRPRAGVTQETTAIDDGSSTRTFRSTSRDIEELLDQWWSFLGLGATGPGKAFSVDLMPNDALTGTWGVDYVWISTTHTGPVP